MKYRHSFHAGNFADVHKHVALLALLSTLKRKEKGFAYFETHAGRGAYDLSHASAEAQEGTGRFTVGEYVADELRRYAAWVSDFRSTRNSRAYPGSPLLAARELRPQDRALLCEIIPAEARMLERELGRNSTVRVERGDGFERLRAWLPPVERRGLIFIDPPYEQSRQDFERVTASIADALQRFSTGIFAAWYPIKDEREIRAWHGRFGRAVRHETLASEMWLYPRDSQVALNGSGLLIVNPPYLLAERMQVWLPELQSQLEAGHGGGTSVTKLPRAT
ncbi:MAG: 23S rRNA (adenine(2030)-N(6))-methyltransferase RlmJ [Steroidobacteraceae bacterium]